MADITGLPVNMLQQVIILYMHELVIGKNAPRFAYSEGVISVIPDDIPETPKGFNAVVNGATVSACWGANYEEDFLGYRILYTDRLDRSDYNRSIAVGNVTNFDIGTFKAGRRYRLAVIAYNQNGKEKSSISSTNC